MNQQRKRTTSTTLPRQRFEHLNSLQYKRSDFLCAALGPFCWIEGRQARVLCTRGRARAGFVVQSQAVVDVGASLGPRGEALV